VRTAFDDAVARFGGAVLPRTSVVFSSSAASHATSDTSVALRNPTQLNSLRRISRSQDRFTSHDVNRT
jgi:hypothetical protein